MIRWTTIIALCALLVGAISYDRVSLAPEPSPEIAAAPVASPVLRDPTRLSSVWYCPVGSSNEGGFANHTVVVTNVGQNEVSAEVAVVTAEGAAPSLRVAVAPLTSETVALSDLATSSRAGAVVDIVGGDAIVSHSVVTATGSPSGPCHSSLAETWHLASGATTRDAHNYVALLNPFSSDVVFSATFQTETRTREPGELDRAVVPARSVLVLDVGEYVSREAVVATTITTVQGGRLAVEQLQTFDGELGPVGAALNLGVATPLPTWRFPVGRLQPSSNNFVRIFNPSADVAEVDLELDPLDPADRAAYGLVPIELTVQPGRVQSFDLGEALADYALPVSFELGVTAVSTNGVPVVIDRWQATPPIDTSLIGAGGDSADGGDEGETTEVETAEVDEPDGEGLDEESQAEAEAILSERLSDPALAPPVQPDPDIGISLSHGFGSLATRWIVPQLVTLDAGRTVVVVSAPAGALVEVRLVVAGEVLSPQRVSVAANGRALIEISPVSADAVVLVEADAPVAAAGYVVNPGVDRQFVPGIPVVSDRNR